MSTFFRGITEIVPSLFRGIFSERNSVPNPMYKTMKKSSRVFSNNAFIVCRSLEIYAEVNVPEKEVPTEILRNLVVIYRHI
jgi:hypothetical protein